MKAVGLSSVGSPEVLGLYDLPEPHPGSEEVRIRVEAFAVNPADTLFRSRSDRHPAGMHPPFIPGMDAAGVIDEIGPGSRWHVGETVMGMALPNSKHGGAYVQYLIAPDDSITRTPVNVSIEEAATISMNGLTATQIIGLLDLEAGATIAVTGAAGVLGNYVIQLGKQSGLTVIADSQESDRELLESLGADHIVARGEGMIEQIRRIAPHGVEAVVDTALLMEYAVPVLRDGGVFVSVRGWKGEPARRIRFEAASVGKDYLSHAKLDALRDAVERENLTPRVAKVLPASGAPEAHRLLEAGGTRGRFVLKF